MNRYFKGAMAVILILLLFVSCAIRKRAEMPPNTSYSRDEARTTSLEESGETKQSLSTYKEKNADDAAPREAESAADKKGKEFARKIIRSASVNLFVENFDVAANRVDAITSQFRGQVADKDVQRSGNYVHGVLTIWVPVDDLLKYVDEIKTIGRVTNLSVHAQDISDQYYDQDARLRNSKKQEERLLALLDKKGTNLDQILKLEKELARIRQEIEVMEGRQRRWDYMVAYSTVTINISQDVQAVKEPDDVWKPIRQAIRDAKPTFMDSIAGVLGLLAWLFTTIIALIPWVPVVILVLWLYRKFSARMWGRMSQKITLPLPGKKKTPSPEDDVAPKEEQS